MINLLVFQGHLPGSLKPCCTRRNSYEWWLSRDELVKLTCQLIKEIKTYTLHITLQNAVLVTLNSRPFHWERKEHKNSVESVSYNLHIFW